MHLPMYILSTSIHVIAAMIWVGGMLFMTLMLIPALRKLGDPALMARLIESVGTRFKVIGWGCLVTLLVTGYTNLLSRGFHHAVLGSQEFWQSSFGELLAGKIGLFVGIIALSLAHDTVVGPRFRRLRRDPAAAKSVERYRKAASWVGRLTLVLSILAVLTGIMLVRGRPW